MQPARAADAAAEDSDEVLVARLTAGDHAAFAQLVRRHQALFYAHAWRTVANRAEAEDCVQDAFLKLWRNPAAFDAGRGHKFVTWFYRVVTNAAIDIQRRRRERADSDAADRMVAQDALPDRALEEDDRARAVDDAIRRLPERQRAALNLCFYEGLSNVDAAGVLDVKVKALESLLMRAKAGLRDELRRNGWLDAGGGE